MLTADNGKYVSWQTVEFEDDEAGGDTYVAETVQATKQRLDRSCEFKVASFNLRQDGKVFLKAINDKFLCRIDHEENFQPIEASSTEPKRSCRFDVFNQPDGTIALQADNGKYLCRVKKFGIDLIVADKPDTIDFSCKFRFLELY